MRRIDKRNARLDALKSATEAWAKKRTTQMEDQVSFSKQLLKGRNGSERLAAAPVNIAKELLQDSINQFLTGKK